VAYGSDTGGGKYIQYSGENLHGRDPLVNSGIYQDFHNHNLQPKFIFYNYTYYEKPLYKRKNFQNDIGSRPDI
jgi:hypothetical protein